MLEGRRLTAASAAVVSFAAGLACGAVAVAQPMPADLEMAQNSLRGGLFDRPVDGRKPQYPPVGRYVAAQGDGFVLDRTAKAALLKYDGGTEVFVLYPQPGPRGDVIWRNDIGEPVLRTTRLGGLTLFSLDRPTGTPVAFATAAGQLKPRALSPGALLQVLATASKRASRAARRLLPFEAPQVQPGEEPLYADAAFVAADGVVSVSGSAQGRGVLTTLRRVRFTVGLAPSAMVREGTLEIVLVPDRGLAGRPSSKRAEQALLAQR